MSENTISSTISRNLDKLEVSINGKKSRVEYNFGKTLRNRFQDLLATRSDQELKNMKPEIKKMVRQLSPEHDNTPGRVPMKIHESPDLTATELEEARQLLRSEQNTLQQIFFDANN